MRVPEYLSPTSIQLFYKDVNDFYIRYLCDTKSARDPQTLPMSVGSAFDAYIKAYLYEALNGPGHNPKYTFDALFTSQVEPQNRDWALINGKYVFDCYKNSGAASDLLLNLQSAIGSPRFEFEVKGIVNGHTEAIQRTYGDMILLGKPDAFYINKHGFSVILDFKVNGFCSKSNTSPKKGYVRLRHGSGTNRMESQHKDCHLMSYNGEMINGAIYLEDIEDTWSRQLATYAWLLGEPVGSEFVVAIDQIVAKPSHPFPELRIAEHRLRVSSDFQKKIFNEASYVWNTIKSGHIFQDMSREASDARCLALDSRAGLINQTSGSTDSVDMMFAEMAKPDPWK